MQILGTDIIVNRGESFSIDFSLRNKDGSPYILTNKSNNPFFLLTVSSTKYLQEGRYIRNWWLKIPEELRFYNTNPVEISKAFVDTNAEPDVDKGDYTGDLSTYAIYYYVHNDIKIYKRWTGSEYVDYDLRIIKVFTKADTFEWIAQNYVYSINYVDGVSMLEYLTDQYSINNLPAPIPTSVEELFDKLSQFDSKYSNVLIDRELYSISISLPIINSSSLSVVDNIEGGIL